ncbi:MAG TPA: hypothetical protein VHB79_09190 [Polyangiaceae bacterium]|nr:hypothetical protein [Polyangiaceae bacterium]
MAKNPRFTKRLLTAFTAGLALLGITEHSQAQELYLTGPLAGAPAVRKLRLYRQTRLEVSPTVSFTLLDEYRRTMFLGARLQFNFTDWLAVGAWGAYGVSLGPTALTEKIQKVNKDRHDKVAPGAVCDASTPAALQASSMKEECKGPLLSKRLTEVNLGPDMEKQLGQMNWVAAPQLTVTPFRGKLALFQSLYVDTDFYISAGWAFIGVTERKNCDPCAGQYDTASRMAMAPTFAAGMSFYVAKFMAVGFEWRGLPFAWNRGGFDTAGTGKDKAFPDNKITDADQAFRLNQMMTLSLNFYLPPQYKVSE